MKFKQIEARMSDVFALGEDGCVYRLIQEPVKTEAKEFNEYGGYEYIYETKYSWKKLDGPVEE